MKPEDRARLEVIRTDWCAVYSAADASHGLVLRIIDEQAAEIARLKTQSENQARIIDTQRRLAQCGESKFEAENETLKEQLAEERAKREAAENLFHGTHGVHHSWVAGYEQERARADKAERELAEERAARARADAARANLRDKLDRLAAHSNGVADEVERWCVVAANWEGRAEKAEVRTIAAERELERWRHGSTVEGDFVCPNELRTADAETRVGEYLVAVSKAVYPGATKHPAFDSSWILTELANTLENYRERVAELQALVDAALPHCYARDCDKLATHSDPHLYGDYACDEHARCPMGRVHYAKYVIALARDLAAKEKEPTQ